MNFPTASDDQSSSVTTKAQPSFQEISVLLTRLMQLILRLQIAMASTKKPMHNWPGLKANTAVYCAAERSKREWIPFTGRTETRTPEIYT